MWLRNGIKYMERSGTPAAVLNDKVPQEVKESRRIGFQPKNFGKES